MKKIILFLSAILLTVSSFAKVAFPSVLSDNMVLQRNTEVNLWGKAKANVKIRVKTSWNDKRYVTQSDGEGNWLLQVETGEAGGPYEITVSDGETSVLGNILLGEVWVCGGQSNMEITMRGYQHQPVENASEFILYSTKNRNIRLFNMKRVSGASEPQEDCVGTWEVSDPSSVEKFSAVGYMYGYILHQVLGGVPVGLVSANWGGTPIETWMTIDKLNATEGRSYKFEHSDSKECYMPQTLFNSMIWPIRKYTSRGFIWYQGETNISNWYLYKNMMVSMVSLWREIWNNEEMPFYYVQLAPYEYNGSQYHGLPLLIEAQVEALKEIPHSGIVSTTDIGCKTCIHPRKKLEVAQRLAYLALANDYGIKGLPAPAPMFNEIVSRENNKLILSFDNVTESLDWAQANSFEIYAESGFLKPEGFEIAGEEKIFHKAEAQFIAQTNKIEVWSDEVPAPVAVRYAFHNFCKEANVRTTYGQPLIPFRTDRWEIKDN